MKHVQRRGCIIDQLFLLTQKLASNIRESLQIQFSVLSRFWTMYVNHQNKKRSLNNYRHNNSVAVLCRMLCDIIILLKLKQSGWCTDRPIEIKLSNHKSACSFTLSLWLTIHQQGKFSLQVSWRFNPVKNRSTDKQINQLWNICDSKCEDSYFDSLFWFVWKPSFL